MYEESGNSNYTYTKGERLYRNENNKVIAGVCGGIAAYFGIDPLIVRILFVVFALGFGFGFLVYLVLWVAVPSTASAVIGSARKRLLRDPEDKLIGGVWQRVSLLFWRKCLDTAHLIFNSIFYGCFQVERLGRLSLSQLFLCFV